MLGSFRKSPAQLQALDRIQGWTRERFKLKPEMVVMAAEVACALPGCPPLETVVAFWTAPDLRHHFKIFKTVLDVVPDDLPYAWQKSSLRVSADGDFDCC